MVFSPDHTWQWFYDNKHQRLALAMGEEWMFLSAFTEKQLNPDCFYQRPFTAEHASHFNVIVERLQRQVSGSEETIAQIALNAVAAKYFSIPLMPKSWYFSPSSTIVYATEGKTVELQSSQQQAQFLVIESNEQASLLMLLDQHCSLSDSKSLAQFGLVKVMNDRLMPVSRRTDVAIVAA